MPSPRRWTIKRVPRGRYDGVDDALRGEQAVVGDDTDWVEVIEAAPVVERLREIADGADGRCAADHHDECGCLVMMAEALLADLEGKDDG